MATKNGYFVVPGSDAEQAPLYQYGGRGKAAENAMSGKKLCFRIFLSVLLAASLVALALSLYATLKPVGLDESPLVISDPPPVPTKKRTVLAQASKRLTWSPRSNIISSTATVFTLEYPEDLSDFVGQRYVVYSNTTLPHQVVFTAAANKRTHSSCPRSQGPTWDDEGLYPVARFIDGQGPGALLHWIVPECGRVMVIQQRHVQYCTRNLQTCVLPPVTSANISSLFAGDVAASHAVIGNLSAHDFSALRAVLVNLTASSVNTTELHSATAHITTLVTQTLQSVSAVITNLFVTSAQIDSLTSTLFVALNGTITHLTSVTASIQTLIAHAVNVSGTLTTTHLKIVDMLDTSTSHVLPSPLFIVVGNGTPGVVDWPESVLGSRHMNEMARLRYVSSRNNNSTKKRNFQNIPIFPSLLPNGPMPPPGAVFVNTIKDALELLQGKVVTNTTILIRAGTYHENVYLDGFVSNCGRTYTSDINENQGITKCRGVNFIGDARVIAGFSYVHGVIADLYAPPHPAIGADLATSNITCVSSTSIRIDRIITPFLSYLEDFPTPDFNVLGIVPGDRILIGDGATKTAQEKTVVSVSGNVIEFSPAGCVANGDVGSSVTFLPNRKIVAQAPVGSGSAPPTLQESLQTVASAFSVEASVNIMGLWVTEPEQPNSLLQSLCTIGGNDPFLYGLVCDARQGNYHLLNGQVINTIIQTKTSTGSFFGPNLVQGSPLILNSPYLTDAFNTIARYSGHLTIIGGRNDFIKNSVFDIETLTVINGQMVAFHGTPKATIHQLQVVSNFGIACDFAASSHITVQSLNCFGAAIGVRLSSQALLHSLDVYSVMKLAGSINCIRVQGEATWKLTDHDAVGLIFLPEQIPTQFFTCPTAISVRQRGVLHLDRLPTLSSGAGATAVVSQTTDVASVIIGNVPYQASTIFTTDTQLSAEWSVQYLAGTGNRTMTLSATNLALMANKEFRIVSLTTGFHTVTLSGGAVWSSGNTVATWPGQINTALSFFVVSSTEIMVTNNVGPVTFSP